MMKRYLLGDAVRGRICYLVYFHGPKKGFLYGVNSRELEAACVLRRCSVSRLRPHEEGEQGTEILMFRMMSHARMES